MNGAAIVVTCYNLGRYLGETLESVRLQTRPATELVVIDDGSTEPYTLQALARAARAGTYVVQTGNGGVAAARKLGVSLTSSPYIVLLDGDDLLDPAYLERLAGALDGRPDLDFVTCGLRAFGETEYEWTPPPCTWAQTLARGGPHISTIFRRRVWDRVGGFDPTLTGYEDTDFWLSVLEENFRGEVVAEPLLRYRVRSGSRYHRAIQRDDYVPTMGRIHRKHPPRSAEDRTTLLVEKERFLAEQRAHQAVLRTRLGDLERALAESQAQVGDLRATIELEGVAPLDWGDLRRVSPISPVWGLDRGKPLDRHYIEQFLDRHRSDIRGRVAEVKDPGYSTRYGTGVTQQEVIDVDSDNLRATIIADLAVPDSLPPAVFDCIVFTQTLHIIYDTQAVLGNLFRSLKPGGVLLCTVPCVSRISYEDGGLDDGDFWRFTEASARTAFAEVFPVDNVEVTSRGNVMMCAAFLHGLDPGEVPAAMLETDDPYFPLICSIRAVKPAATAGDRRSPIRLVAADAAGQASAVLMYHRVGSRRPDTHNLCVDTVQFRDQMRYIRDHCCPLPLEILATHLERADLPARAVAVTFDDGYLENLTVVSPILLEFGIPATFFVNTAQVDEHHEGWWDTLERVFLSGDDLPPTLDLADIGMGVQPSASAGERAAIHRALVERIYPMGSAERDRLLARVSNWSGIDLRPRASHRLMTGDDIVALSTLPGLTIGAHSVNHLALPLHTPGVQMEEVAACRERLEALTSSPVGAFAYPYGEFSAPSRVMVRRAGFRVAVTVEGRVATPAADRFLLPRFEMRTSPDFRVELWFESIFGDARGHA